MKKVIINSLISQKVKLNVMIVLFNEILIKFMKMLLVINIVAILWKLMLKIIITSSILFNCFKIKLILLKYLFILDMAELENQEYRIKNHLILPRESKNMKSYLSKKLVLQKDILRLKWKHKKNQSKKKKNLMEIMPHLHFLFRYRNL
jgi:hypothetical protein